MLNILFQGGGTEKVNTSVQNQPKIQQPAKKETLKPVKTTKLLLTGTDGQNGVMAHLSLYVEENGSERWNVDKVTWQGALWRNNWTLFYDDKTREYIFTDRDWIDRGERTCWGQARKWGSNKVCLANGVVLKQYENIYRTKFPKIRLDGWQVVSSRMRGYNANVLPTYLEHCQRVNVKERDDNNLEVSINCKNATLQKTFKNLEK